MTFRFAMAGAAGVLVSLALTATAGAHLSPMPSVCTGEPNPGCIEKGGGGDVTVSPTLVHVGDVLTIKLQSIKGQYGGVISWNISSRATGPSSSSPSLKLLGCKPTHSGALGNGSALCRYRVRSSGRGWQAGVAMFQVEYGGLASFSEAAWRVVPKGSFVEGYVRGLPRHKGEQGIGLSGVQMVARGKSSDSTKTNDQGYYVLQLAKPGSYEVFPKRRASDNRLRPVPKFDPDSRKVQLDSKRIKDIDFRLNRGDDIRVSFVDPGGHAVSSIPANGVASATVLVDASDANDQPISDKNGMKVIVDDSRFASKAILCSAQNVRIWPGETIAGSRSAVVDDHDPSATTPDAHGQLKLTLHAGTAPGSVTVTVRVADAALTDPGRSATLRIATVPDPAPFSVALTAAKNNTNAPYPSGNANEGSAWQDEMAYLLVAKQVGQFAGWDITPLMTTAGSPTRYGIYFTRNDGKPGGGVLESNSQGFTPLENNAPLPTLAQWAAGQSYTTQLLQSGYPGDDLLYGGWPYERTPADTCIRRGPA